MHPTDGRQLTVSMDESITPKEAIEELIACGFITKYPSGYGIAVKGGNMLDNKRSFYESGVGNQATLRIIPGTDAG